MTVADLIERIQALPDHERIVMLAHEAGPVECAHVLEMRSAAGEAVCLFDEDWNNGTPSA